MGAGAPRQSVATCCQQNVTIAESDEPLAYLSRLLQPSNLSVIEITPYRLMPCRPTSNTPAKLHWKF